MHTLHERPVRCFRHELEEAVDLPIDLYTDLDDPILVENITSRGEIYYEV